MVLFKDIMPSEHYESEHVEEIPWEKIVEIIHAHKRPRKKGDKYEIENDGYYILFELKNEIVFVINAKKG